VTDPDSAERIRKFYEAIAIPADSFARAVAFAMSQPEDVNVNEILFRPTRQELCKLQSIRRRARLRPPAGQDRPRQGRVGLRADRSGRSGADLAGALGRAGFGRASPEAAEGLASFRDQRDPAWYAPA
jgi:hypothetical protein